MLRVGVTPLGTLDTGGAVAIATPTPYLRWRIDLLHRSGGLKKSWFLGQDNCPISAVDFEENLKGMGAGTIEMAFLDFPVDADDRVKIYFYGNLRYYGIVNVSPDAKGGTVEIIPVWQRYSELLHNAAYTTKTIAYILEQVVTAAATDSGIAWNASLVDTGESTTYTITYNYESIDKIMDDLTSRLTDRHWGVTAGGFFYLQPLASVVTKNLYYSDMPPYTDIEVENDYSGIEATRAQVYKKVAGSGETVRIGEVGYGGSYPILPIETLYRKIEKQITVSEVLSDSEALSYAYIKLQSYQPIRAITINNIDLDRYQPEIGTLVTVQDREEIILNTIIDCESTTGWTNATLDTSLYCEGSASVYRNFSAIGDSLYYASSTRYYYRPQRIGFMIRSSESGQFLQLKISYRGYYNLNSYSSGIYSDEEYSSGDSTGPAITEISLTNNINIPSAGVWYFVSFDASTYDVTSIPEIRFVCNATPTGTAKVNIDRVQLYQYYRAEYESNVVQINYSITKDSEVVTAKLDSYDKAANARLIDFDRKIATLEKVSQQN